MKKWDMFSRKCKLTFTTQNCKGMYFISVSAFLQSYVVESWPALWVHSVRTDCFRHRLFAIMSILLKMFSCARFSFNIFTQIFLTFCKKNTVLNWIFFVTTRWLLLFPGRINDGMSENSEHENVDLDGRFGVLCGVEELIYPTPLIDFSCRSLYIFFP